jgi:hypothetical protein
MNLTMDSATLNTIKCCMSKYFKVFRLSVRLDRDGAYRSWIAKNKKEVVSCSGEIRITGIERPLVYLTISSSGCLHGVWAAMSVEILAQQMMMIEATLKYRIHHQY